MAAGERIIQSRDIIRYMMRHLIRQLTVNVITSVTGGNAEEGDIRGLTGKTVTIEAGETSA